MLIIKPLRKQNKESTDHQNDLSSHRKPVVLELPISATSNQKLIANPQQNAGMDSIEREVDQVVQLLISTLSFHEITNTKSTDEAKDDDDERIESDVVDHNQTEFGGVVDPRVTVELDILNQRNDAINKLELELGEARQAYSSMIHEANDELETIERKLGSCVATTQIYYDAMDDLNKVRISHQAARDRFKRAQEIYLSIQEFIDQIENNRVEKGLSPLWDRTLHDAMDKVEEVKREKSEADLEVQRSQMLLVSIQEALTHSEKGSKRNIKRAKPFYDRKSELHRHLQEKLIFVRQLEKCVLEAKNEYNEALRKLEKISNQIHDERRNMRLNSRNGSSGSEETRMTAPNETSEADKVSRL